MKKIIWSLMLILVICMPVVFAIEPSSGGGGGGSSVCDVYDTLIKGETKTFKTGGIAYETTLLVVSEETSEAKFTVNGETTNLLARYESQTLSDGSKITVNKILMSTTDAEKNAVEFCISSGLQECTDSDGGDDIYVKGTSYGHLGPDRNLVGSRTDYCIIGNSASDVGSCQGDDCKVYEFSCMSNEHLPVPFVNGNIFSCPNGCKDGACIKAQTGQLVSYWSFNGHAMDSIGNNHGTPYGATLSSGVDGQAYIFDGYRDYVLVGDKPDLEPQEFTLSFWAKLNNPSGEYQGGIAKGYVFGNVYEFSYRMDFHLSQIRAGITNTDNNRFNTYASITDTNWHHWVMTVGNGRVITYKDGQEVDSIAYTGTIDYTKTRNNFVIGARDSISGNCDDYCSANGLIDEVKFWNYVLSTSAIQKEYNSITPPAENKICTDSDGGKDYYTQGSVKVCTETESVCNDYGCTGGGGCSVAVDICSDSNTVLENYCYGAERNSVKYTCPNGCRDGACIQEIELNHLAVVDDRAPASDVILISDLAMHFKGEYPVGSTKLNSEVTRSMLDYRVTTFVCNGRAAIIVGTHSPSEHVILAGRIEDYLDRRGISVIRKMDYEVKYDDLRKIFEDVPSVCSDSDGGINYDVKGDIIVDGGIKNTDYCIEDEPVPNMLNEFYCLETPAPGGITHIQKIYQCPNGCRDGACIKEEKTCKDSDGGLNYYVKGETYDKGAARPFTDTCQDGVVLTEHWCEDGRLKGVPYRCPNGCRDGACIGELTEIDVNLNQKFDLKERQSAQVVDYNGMKVRLNSIVKECGYATSSTATSEGGSGGGGGGVGCRLIGAKVEVEMPTSCKVSSGNEECATTGTGFMIKKGETRDVFGAELSLLELRDNMGRFVVSKQTENDYVDVTISPESQEIYYGESAKYSITIKDKHPMITCVAAPCIQEEYTYFVKIRNLPFNKEYEKQVTLNSGETITTSLIVSPFVVVEEEVDAEETIAITGQVTASGGGGLGVIAKKVAVVSEETAEEVISSEAVEEEAEEEVAQVEEAIEEEAPIMVSVPNLYRQYSFSVHVQQKNDPKVRDEAYAKLIVKPRIEPPEFPTEEITIKLYKGWNLISLPGKLVRFAEDGCTSRRKLLGFVYLKEKQEYVSLQEAQGILGNEFQDYLAKNSFWIYSYDECKLRVQLELEVSYSGINLYKGWNLIPITEDMVGGYLGEILGDCNIEKIYKWEAPNQEWKKISKDYVFSDWETSYGFIAKVSDYCSLGGVSILAPPEWPE